MDATDTIKSLEVRQEILSRFKSEFIRHMFYGLGEVEPNIYRIVGETHNKHIVLQNIRNSKYIVWDEERVQECEFVKLDFLTEETFIPAKDSITHWRWKGEGDSSDKYETDPRIEYGGIVELRIDRWVVVK